MMKNLIKKLIRNRKGAAFVEYALLVGGIALVAAGAISTFGHKATDILGTMAVIIPGAHVDDNNPITSGKLIETALQANGGIGVDPTAATGVLSGNGKDRLFINIAGGDGAVNGFGGMVLEAH